MTSDINFEVSPANINIGSAANLYASFNVISDISWSISDNADWLEVDPNEGTGNGTITVRTNTANTSGIPRSVAVMVNGISVGTKIVTVTQSSGGLFMNVNPSSLNLNSAANIYGSFSIISNTTWSVSDNAAWLEVDPNDGTGNETIIVKTNTANTSGSSRSVSVIINGNSVDTKIVNVTQEGQNSVNTITINSVPSGASIYMDGTNMNKTTPAVLTGEYSGNHNIRLFKIGYNEYNHSFYLTTGGSYTINANMGNPVPPIPVITITSPEYGNTYNDNVISVSGYIKLKDIYNNITDYNGTKAILTLNGVDKEISIYNGQFNETISILSGTNKIRIRANSDNGDTGISDELIAYGYFTGPNIEVTLTWNTPTSDIDLHVWNPNGEHSCWHNLSISDGFLDIDDVEGYGPETFTSNTAINGQYIIKINSYDLDHDNYADATVQIQINGGTVHTYGPHHFNVADREGNNTGAWWNVAIINFPQGIAKSSGNEIPDWLKIKIESDMKNLKQKEVK